MELIFTNNLKIACTDMDSLLESQSNEKFTIRTVIEVLSKQEKKYHHNVRTLLISFFSYFTCVS